MAPKKKSFETLHFRFNFPHPAMRKVKFPTPRAQKVVKCPGFAQVGDVEVSIWSVHNSDYIYLEQDTKPLTTQVHQHWKWHLHWWHLMIEAWEQIAKITQKTNGDKLIIIFLCSLFLETKLAFLSLEINCWSNLIMQLPTAWISLWILQYNIQANYTIG